jgi:hypothetical protein
MVKRARVAFIAALVGLAAGVGLFGAVPSARAVSTSDKPAAILVWPKIVVDTLGRFNGGVPIETLVQISNTNTSQLKQAYCFYVNANSHCRHNPAMVCQDASDCPNGPGFSPCDPGWSEIDFTIMITRDQPLAWYASEGLRRGDFPLEGPGFCASPPGRPCFRNQDCAGSPPVCNLGQTNLGSGIPPVPEDPFQGTLKCIQFDPSANPPVPDQSPTTNALKGEATIMSLPPLASTPPFEPVDVAKYNAIGLRATQFSNGNNKELVIGGAIATAEYAACPNTLILDHFFDFAVDPIAVGAGLINGENGEASAPQFFGDISPNGQLFTDLTLVPCGDDFLRQRPGRVVAQFLVFNEFEQRFSTSRTVDCYYQSPLSLIDTTNPVRSIFSAHVSGTIAGQTRIRGVGSAPTGRGLLGVAWLFAENLDTGGYSSAAYNLHQQGDPPASIPPDLIILP